MREFNEDKASKNLANHAATASPSAPNRAIEPTWTLISSESADDFEALKTSVKNELKPKGIIEHVLVNDFISHEWELRRLRRIAAAIYNVGKPLAVAKLLGVPEKRMSESALPTGQYANALEALAGEGFSGVELNAQVAVMHCGTFESIEKRSAVLEVRRNHALAKLEERRAAAKTVEHSGTAA
jgi:hypothetical protein